MVFKYIDDFFVINQLAVKDHLELLEVVVTVTLQALVWIFRIQSYHWPMEKSLCKKLINVITTHFLYSLCNWHGIDLNIRYWILMTQKLT